MWLNNLHPYLTCNTQRRLWRAAHRYTYVWFVLSVLFFKVSPLFHSHVCFGFVFFNSASILHNISDSTKYMPYYCIIKMLYCISIKHAVMLIWLASFSVFPDAAKDNLCHVTSLPCNYREWHSHGNRVVRKTLKLSVSIASLRAKLQKGQASQCTSGLSV